MPALLFLVVLISPALLNKKSDFYPDAKTDIQNFASLQTPFRMQKMNLVWEKARLTMALTETKLAKLYSDLKMQDKEELTLKRLKAEGGDKEGVKESEIRARFGLILKTYGMSGSGKEESFSPDKRPAKELFKDKKLQKLWEKAEKSGLTSTELLSLQEEFQHHQQKVDEYNQLMELAGNDDHIKYNTIQKDIEKEVFDIRDTNEVKKRYKNVKEGYDRLHRLATNQGENEGFSEPKVAGLWKIALEADFEDEELESIRQELGHYEKRIEKLRFLQNELQLVDERHGGKYGSDDDDDKTEGRRVMDRKLAKNTEAVEKLHDSLEKKILTRHREL